LASLASPYGLLRFGVVWTGRGGGIGPTSTDAVVWADRTRPHGRRPLSSPPHFFFGRRPELSNGSTAPRAAPPCLLAAFFVLVGFSRLSINTFSPAVCVTGGRRTMRWRIGRFEFFLRVVNLEVGSPSFVFVFFFFFFFFFLSFLCDWLDDPSAERSLTCGQLRPVAHLPAGRKHVAGCRLLLVILVYSDAPLFQLFTFDPQLCGCGGDRRRE